jgi:hypothetical protein
LPQVYGPLLDGTVLGELTEAHLEAIRDDVRWYGNGAPKWKKAPSNDDAIAKGVASVRRLQHSAYLTISGTLTLAQVLEACFADKRCGSMACAECGRAFQRWLVRAVGDRLKHPTPGFRDFSFNFVMPDGQAPIHDLGSVDFDAILNKCRDALAKFSAVEFAVLGIDTSANDDTDKFAKGKLCDGPKVYWQAHIYGIVRATHRQAVWDALHGLFPKAPNIFRPLWVSPGPFSGSAAGISYMCKPDAFRRVPYRNEHGEWATPRVPPALKAREQVHFMLAMHDLGFARRIAFVRLHPVLTPATKTRPRGVRLIPIFMREVAM